MMFGSRSKRRSHDGPLATDKNHLSLCNLFSASAGDQNYGLLWNEFGGNRLDQEQTNIVTMFCCVGGKH